MSVTSAFHIRATITTTFRCADGTLEVEFTPTQFSHDQGSAWTIVSGTESFKGSQGRGSMVAKFDSDNPGTGGEVFTGLVSDQPTNMAKPRSRDSHGGLLTRVAEEQHKVTAI